MTGMRQAFIFLSLKRAAIRLPIAGLVLLFISGGWVGLAVAAGAGLALDPAPEGLVRFYNIANSDFDIYSKNPSSEQQAWMRQKFTRMQTYSPYFDRRLAWYPAAWFYKDSYALKPDWPEYVAHPEWLLRDAQGTELYIPWGCKNGRCPQFAADFGNPAFRAHWIKQAQEKIALGYRGIWIDDVNLRWRVGDGWGQHQKPIDPRTGRAMTLGDWRRYFAEFMEAVREALPGIEIAHNLIWYAGPFDDPSILRQIDAADFINLERGASDPGLKRGNGEFGFERFLAFIDLVHARGKAVILMDYGNSQKHREFGLAAWFLINSGRDLISSNQLRWTSPGSFWPGYELNLGHASGPRVVWRGLLRRDFDCGMVLLNQPGAPARALAMPRGYRRIDQRAAGSFLLGGGEAAVILRGCGSNAD